MLGQQRQSLDLKPLPPPPPEVFEEPIRNDHPSQTAADRKETSGLFKKLASKLKSPVVVQLDGTTTTARRSTTIRGKNTPPLMNDFTSKEQREAALKKCGLIAVPKKDLSELEQDLDRKYTKVTPIPEEDAKENGQPSAAEKIRQEWKAKNQNKPRA